MKKIIYAVFLVFFLSCKSNNHFYSGYLYYENKPLEKAIVYEKDSIKNSTTTDNEGYFYLHKNKEWISDLVVKYKNYSDTIRTVGKQGGEKIIYSFVNNSNDTLFLDFDKSKLK